MLYCKLKFGRGRGFGNRLYLWARCRIFSKLHNGVVVSPIWTRLAIGQLFRGGIDYKSYLRQIIMLGLFKKRENDLGVFSGYLKTCLIPTLDEPENLHHAPQYDHHIKNVKVVFKNYNYEFRCLNGWSDFLLNELRKITKPKYLAIVDRPKSIPIGIVVRCGNDFLEPPEDCVVLKFWEKTPVRWFVKMLSLIRTVVGYDVDAYLVSDGTDKQLADLLAMKNVHFIQQRSAISDLLIMTRANLLLAAGTSSFAAWACFLGKMPTATHVGQSMSAFGIVPTEGQFIGEVNPANPSSHFVEHVKKTLGDATLKSAIPTITETI